MQTIRGVAFAATLAAGGWIAGGWIDGGWIDDGWIGGGWIAGDSVTRDSVTGSWIVGFPTAVAVAAPPVVGDDSSGDSSIAAPTAAPTAASNTAPFGPVVGEDLESRRERVRQMSARDQAELLRKKDRFDRLSPTEQQRMRQLHAELNEDPRAPQLLETLASYSAWLQTLTAAERAELLGMDPRTRVDQIRHLQQEQRRDEARRLGIPQVTIPVEDAKIVMEWIEAYLQRSRPYFEQRVPQLAERLQQTTDRKRQHFMLVYTLMQTFNEPDAIPPIQPGEMKTLAERLTDAHRKQLLAAATPKEQLELILKWCRAAFLRQFEPTRDELEKHYRESLTAEDREWLDAMPRERFQQTLRSLYFRDRQPPPDWNRRFPGGRSRGPGGSIGPGGPSAPDSNAATGRPTGVLGDKDAHRGSSQ